MARINSFGCVGIANEVPQLVVRIDLDPEDNSVAGRVLAMGRANIVFEFELNRHPDLTYGTEALFEFRDEDERYWPRPTIDHNIRVEASRIFIDREDDLTRWQALRHARRCGQVTKTAHNELYSEDVW